MGKIPNWNREPPSEQNYDWEELKESKMDSTRCFTLAPSVEVIQLIGLITVQTISERFEFVKLNLIYPILYENNISCIKKE